MVLPVLRAGLLSAGIALLASGCNVRRDELARARTAFEQDSHERVMAMLRVLERDFPRMSESDQARYSYLRGMTDFRIGYRLDARHWLALALALETQAPGSIPGDWKQRAEASQKELDRVVFDSGYRALSNNYKKAPQAPSSPKTPVGDEDL